MNKNKEYYSNKEITIKTKKGYPKPEVGLKDVENELLFRQYKILVKYIPELHYSEISRLLKEYYQKFKIDILVSFNSLENTTDIIIIIIKIDNVKLTNNIINKIEYNVKLHFKKLNNKLQNKNTINSNVEYNLIEDQKV